MSHNDVTSFTSFRSLPVRHQPDEVERSQRPQAGEHEAQHEDVTCQTWGTTGTTAPVSRCVSGK